MYELIQVLNNTYYINCPAKIGLYLDVDKGVYLIDSGNDKEAGRKVRQILDKNGWTLRAILCTHSHADHIGGCKYLQAQTGCKVYSPGVERDFTRHTLLEPALLYGGFPPKALRHKFLMAQESDADEIAGRIKVFCAKPVNFEALLKRLFDEYALELSFEQYALVGSTVKSYLAWLMDKGQLKAKCESNLLLWEAAE